MRRLFVVFALLAMMVSLRALQTETTQGADPLTLAAIGFVVLAAFALAELGSRLSLPKVTGYILSGVALGPFVADVLSQPVVNELKMFSELALGLIATTAGLELDLKALGRLARTLGVTVAIKFVAGIVLVGTSLVVVEMATGALGLPDNTSIIAMGLVFAALSLGTSPAIALAVQSETGAKGRLSEIVLGAAVVKDVVVVVSLAIALAAAEALLGGGGVGIDVVIHLAQELGTSVGAGLVLGFILIAYLRWVKSEMLLFVAAMILVVAEISAILHLELLLVFIVAGVVVRNASHYEHDLLPPLQTVSLPVFIVFFTTAGANVDLGATWSVLPVALVLCTARAAGYYVAGRVGGRAGNEPEPVRRLAWLGYLPQAGVTLGLVGLAAKGLPDLASYIATLGMAVVAVNLLVGPITLRLALQGAGETADATHEDETTVQADVVIRQELPDELEDPRLRALLGDLRLRLAEPWARWRNDVLQPATTRWQQSMASGDEARDEHGAVSALRGLDRVALEDDHDRFADLRAVLDAQLHPLEALPNSMLVPLEARNAAIAEDDAWRARWSKRITAVLAFVSGRRNRRVRRVPVRIVARTVLEPAMARMAEESLRDWQRYEIECLEVMERVALGTSPGSGAKAELAERQQRFLEKVAANHEASLWAATRELGRSLAVLGAPGVAEPRRYSQVERELSAVVQRLQYEDDAWPGRRRAAVDRLRFNAETELVEHRVTARLQQEVVAPLDAAFERLQVLVTEEQRRLDALPRVADLTDDEAWSRMEVQVRAVLPRPVAKEVRSIGAKVRRATSSDNAVAELRSFVTEGDERIAVVASLETLTSALRPAEVEVVSVDTRELKEVQLAGRVLPLIEECLGQAAVAFTTIRDQMREVVSLMEFGLEAAMRARGEEEGNPALLDEALTRAAGMLQTLQEGAGQGWNEARPRLLAAVNGLAEQLSEMVTATAGGTHARVAQVSRWARMRTTLEQWLRLSIRTLRRLLHALQTGEVGQAAEDLALRYRLRSGLERFDAHAIRSFLEEQRNVRRNRIAGLHASLFGADPLRDPRLFVGDRDILGAIIRAERAWQSDPRHGNGVLVVGASGTGKSSTIGIAQLKLGTRRAVSVRPTDEATTVRAALASALGVADESAAIDKALRHVATVVVIDDLQSFFPPTAEGLASLEAFLREVLDTRTQTFWLCSMAEESLLSWRTLAALEEAFPCRVHLPPLELSNLAAIIEARRVLGGLRCVYPVRRGAWIDRLMRRSPQDVYMRRLSAAAQGSVRRAMDLWRAHSEVTEDTLRLRPIASLSWRLPFVQQLRPEVQAVLALLVRHGALRSPELASSMGITPEALEVHLRFLVASELVTEHNGRYDLRTFVKDDLVSALRETGAVGGGVS